MRRADEWEWAGSGLDACAIRLLSRDHEILVSQRFTQVFTWCHSSHILMSSSNSSQDIVTGETFQIRNFHTHDKVANLFIRFFYLFRHGSSGRDHDWCSEDIWY